VIRRVLASLVLCALSLAAQAAPVTLADCDASGHLTVLHAAADTQLDARAVFLDPARLRWAGNDGGERFRLHFSPTATLTVDATGKVQNSHSSFELERVDTALDPAQAQRFAYLGAGADLAFEQPERLGELLRGQLLLVMEDDDGKVVASTGLQIAAALDVLYAAAETSPPLGAQPTDESTTFRLWAPTAQHVAACLYESSDGPAKSLLAFERDDATGIWQATESRDLSGHYYRYLVDVYAPGVGIVRNRVTDPYSPSLSTDSARSYIANLDSPALKPEGWDAAVAPKRVASATDMTIYELHVRDFSIGDRSVPADHRGKYLAFTDADSAGMRHLRALSDAGITDVHLLPVFDIASVPERGCVTPKIPSAPAGSEMQQAAIAATKSTDCFNWGYDPLHYTAPEGSYASDAADGATRIVEFRRMVQALHGLGLRVGMDVVYNHTSASGQQAKSVLDRIVPGYYHRLDSHGNVERSTCCDNTATEHRMMARLMIDSAVTWARDYRIDSFRFDLMAHQPRAAMEALQRAVDAAAGRHVELLGEGWNFGEVKDGARFVQASQLSLNGSGIATFSDRARDAARGGSAGDNGIDQLRRQGWLNGLHYAPNGSAPTRASLDELRQAADLVRVGLAGSLRDYELHTWSGRRLPLSRIDYAGQPAGYVGTPGEVVNYVENHDNQTLFDLNAFKLPLDTSHEDRARVQILGAALVAFSQGIAYFHAGMDTLRSKSVDRNSFDSGDHFNRLDWSYRDNGFAAGLPPEQDNKASWEWMQPRLADARIKPRPADIAWTRDAFRDLLRIRASSTLFRLRTAQDVHQRLQLLNVGPAQLPTMAIGHLDGRGYEGANFSELLYVINVDPAAQVMRLETERGKDYRLHPVHLAKGAADARIKRQAKFDPGSGELRVPARSAAVFVIE
jgi:pullulanase